MGKYSYVREERKTRKPEIHPVWRGIGFLFMVLIPILSYAGAVVLIEQNNQNKWFPFPYDLVATQNHLLFKLFGDPLIHIKLVLMVGIMFVLYSILAFATFALNSAFGASRYGPYDLPPVQRPKNLRRAR